VKNKLAHIVKVGACALGLVVLLSSGAANAATPAATANPVSTSAAPKPDAVISSAAPAASSAKAPESAANPYGLESLWGTSDAVAKVVLLLLLIMSVGSWYIMVVKVLEQAKMGRQAKAAAKDFWTAGTVQQGAAALEANSAFRFVADAATNALKKHEGLMGHIPLNDWISMGIQRAVDRVQSNTQGGLAFLATVGSISPFVGLFGTVWGIYHALTAIGISGQASIDKVAGPVGEALIMTAIGLAVAVPAVLAYNWLVRRNKAVMDEVRAFSSDLHAVVLGTVNKA
jgi:biopolymer transport protein ExbB